MNETEVNLNIYKDGLLVETLDFGEVQLGATKTLLLTLKNDESDTIVELQPILSEDFSIQDFPEALGGGEERPFHLSYSPTSMTFKGNEFTAKAEGNDVSVQAQIRWKGVLKVVGKILQTRL